MESFEITRTYSTTEDTRERDVLQPRRVLFLFFILNLWTIVMTAVPVLVKSPPNIYTGRNNWYTVDDVIRLAEPIIAFPLQLALLVESKIFSLSVDTPYGIIFAFSLSAAIYQQGAGFHSASAMFKHTIKNFIDENAALAAQYPILTDIYSWMRDLWEHNISHYWYAFGAVGMACVWAWAYRDVYLPSGLTTRTDRALWLLAALLYGVTIGLVAVQFPAGSLVALVFLGGYGFGVVGSALYRRGEMFTWGTRFVLQYFLISYVIALAIVLAWVGITRSVFKTRSDMGW